MRLGHDRMIHAAPASHLRPAVWRLWGLLLLYLSLGPTNHLCLLCCPIRLVSSLLPDSPFGSPWLWLDDMDVHQCENLLGITDSFVFKAWNWGPGQPVEPLYPRSNHSSVPHKLQVSPEIYQAWVSQGCASALPVRLCACPARGHQACLEGTHHGRLPQRGVGSCTHYLVLTDKTLVHFLQDDVSRLTVPGEPQGGGAWVRLCVRGGLWWGLMGTVPFLQTCWLSLPFYSSFFLLIYWSPTLSSLSASVFPRQGGCTTDTCTIASRIIP